MSPHVVTLGKEERSAQELLEQSLLVALLVHQLVFGDHGVSDHLRVLDHNQRCGGHLHNKRRHVPLVYLTLHFWHVLIHHLD